MNKTPKTRGGFTNERSHSYHAYGINCRAAFYQAELPIPAPPNLAGVMGIVGILLGYLVETKFGIGK